MFSRSTERLLEHRRLLNAFAKSPATIGAVAPSSRHLSTVMASDMGLETAETVVELGAGTGAITEVIEKQIPRRALFVALESNADLAAPLMSRFPRVDVLNECAERLPRILDERGRTAADCIVSALPWASFRPTQQERLLDAVVRSLRPGAPFCTIAYVHAALLPAGRRFRRALSDRFSRVTSTPIVWRNLPPAFVYRCR